MSFRKIFTQHIHEEKCHSLSFYQKNGGYEQARKSLHDWQPDDLIETVKAANLRGRGGAGFPTGVKWGFVPKNTDKPKYLAVNADESEPGTFKDRLIMEKNPHLLLEGIIISCKAVGIHHAYIYIRGEFVFAANRLQNAIDRAYSEGILGENCLGSDFTLDVTLHRGAGAYICGEETGMLSSLEGDRGQPKLKPPFPAVEGLFGCPTVVNNVETLANLPYILEIGAEAYGKIGPEKSPGPKLFCVSGHVEKPGVFELPMGISLRTLIDEHAGGVWKGRKLKAVIPGGSSAHVLRADECDVDMDIESLAAAGTMLGSAGVIVMDETTCMVDALLNIMRFYHHESCGQCTPCREGTGWLEKIAHRIAIGEGRMEDMDLVTEVCDRMVGKTICALADAAAFPAESIVKKFREDFVAAIENGGSPAWIKRHPASTGGAATHV
ncbi:MAG: NADH-quinone oxidoreductase subunit NuoF [Planctomycetota bacterium]|nr:NADH-quinone oxidoreductase subunit NuoF [Planctomycetota bacterium]MDG2083632.1 NADH-quinone oxidoreductase subunit NuoF [Planctomycetota bacterium]